MHRGGQGEKAVSVREREETREIHLGDRRLVYSLRRASVRRLTITVNPDLTVSVAAPRGAAPEEVDLRVRRRGVWLHRQLRAFETYHPLPVPRRYVSGETHLYLGRQYRLRVRPGSESVKLSGGFLLVTARRDRAAYLVKAWYREHAEKVFNYRLCALHTAAPWLERAEHSLRIRDMTRRWGSCGPSGVITLNTDLVKAPRSCIDYILAHELCHLLEMNHSKRFYALLERAVPDWRRARERLNHAVRY